MVAPLAALERVSGLLYLSETFGERSHGGEETAVPAIGNDQQQHSISQISRLLGRPKCFSRREDEWHDWSLKVGAIAATLSDHAIVRMNGALQHNTEITVGQPDEASARIFARQMKTLLNHLCEGRSLAIVRGAPDFNGLEVWSPLHQWYQPKTRSKGLALLNEILGWDFRTKEQFLQCMKDWENATLEYNRTKFGHTCMRQMREETARLNHVRQLICDYLRAGEAWKAPRTDELSETNHSNVVPMDVDSLHRKSGKRKKCKSKSKNKSDRPRHYVKKQK